MMIDDQKRRTLRSKRVDWDTEATGLDAGDWITEASTLNPWAKRTPTLILELRGPLLELPWMYLHEYSENKHISSYHKVIWSNWYSPLLYNSAKFLWVSVLGHYFIFWLGSCIIKFTILKYYMNNFYCGFW